MKLPDKEGKTGSASRNPCARAGVGAIRANTRGGTQVGLAENAKVCVPVVETPEHIEAARRATRKGDAPFLTALMEGKFTDSYLEQEGANAPK